MKSKIKLSLLLFDYEIYPRHKICDFNVGELIGILESGKELDPITWDKKTKKIIDGFHRVEAYKRIYGLNYEITGNEIDCQDKAEMVLKGIELNSKHGLKLSTWDKARCINLARVYKIKDQQMKDALGMTEQRFKKVCERIVEVRNKRGEAIREIELKRGQKKIAQKIDGKYVTEEEAERIESNKTVGVPQDARITSLIEDLELGSFNVNNNNVGNIKKLVELMNGAIYQYEVEVA